MAVTLRRRPRRAGSLSRAQVGCGIDVVNLDRFRRAMRRSGQRFLDRIFTPAEQAYARQHHHAVARLAARFAAKEAVIKALSQIDPSRRFDLTQIEVTNDALGRPSVRLAGVAKRYPSVYISLSHETNLAIACAWVMG